jgi:outer membrane immunogenic protein
LGATAGFANGFHTRDDLAGAFLGYPGLSNAQSKGFAAGGTLGFNLQAGSFVYGLEADLSWLGDKSTYVDPNGAINNFFPSETNRLNDLGTVRGRLGLAVDRTLLLFHGGARFRRGRK